MTLLDHLLTFLTSLKARQQEKWLDLVLIDNEDELADTLISMTSRDQRRLRRALMKTLDVAQADLDRASLRLLLERARPLALSAAIWRRQPADTWSLRDAAARYLESLGIPPTDTRLRKMQNLWSRFSTDRARLRISEADLQRQNYACSLCGLRFYNDELSGLGFVSPLGNRPRTKVDPLKPHWSKDEYRTPTLDHRWPVALYGDNARANLVVMCRGCNDGKANFLALHQTRAFVGLPVRTELSRAGVIPTGTFVAQLLRQPYCQATRRGASATELTIRLKQPDRAPVLDNLETVASDDA